MAVVYSWKINALVCRPELDGKKNVVFNVAWERVAQDGMQSAVTIAGETAIALNPESDFTSYAELTESQIVGWIESALGEEHLIELKAEVDKKLEVAITPVVVVPELPWA